MRVVLYARVSSDKQDLDLSISAQLRAQREELHMPGDILWKCVADWEDAVANDFKARRRLYLAVARHLGEATDWPLVGDRDTNEGPAILQGAIDQIYEVSLCLAAGITGREIPYSSYREVDNGRIEGGSRALARAKGKRKEVYELVTKATRELAASPEAKTAATTYRGVQSLTIELHRTIEDLRLLPYLPGVCDVCYRFTD